MSIARAGREPALGEPVRSDREPDGRGSGAAPKRPVVVVLHQLDSSPGHIGQWLQRAGHPSTSADRVSAIPCPRPCYIMPAP